MVWSNQESNTLTFPPGATSGARLTISAAGILIYDSSNDLIFAATPGGFLPVGYTGDPIVFGIGSTAGHGIQVFNGPLADFDLAVNAGGSFEITVNTAPGFTDFQFASAGGIFIAPTLATVGYSRFQFGPGFLGGYYFEQSSYVDPTALFTGTVNQLTMNAAGFTKSSYPASTQIAPTFWTCPDTGIYVINHHIQTLAAATAAGEMKLNLGHTALASDVSQSVGRFAIGDTINLGDTFEGVFNTGDLVYPSLENNCGNNNTGPNNRIITFRRVL